jgi:hypothetical protein
VYDYLNLHYRPHQSTSFRMTDLWPPLFTSGRNTTRLSDRFATSCSCQVYNMSASVSCRYQAGITLISPEYYADINWKVHVVLPWIPCGNILVGLKSTSLCLTIVIYCVVGRQAVCGEFYHKTSERQSRCN